MNKMSSVYKNPVNSDEATEEESLLIFQTEDCFTFYPDYFQDDEEESVTDELIRSINTPTTCSSRVSPKSQPENDAVPTRQNDLPENSCWSESEWIWFDGKEENTLILEENDVDVEGIIQSSSVNPIIPNTNETSFFNVFLMLVFFNVVISLILMLITSVTQENAKFIFPSILLLIGADVAIFTKITIDVTLLVRNWAGIEM